jgi:hypothetical protein
MDAGRRSAEEFDVIETLLATSLPAVPLTPAGTAKSAAVDFVDRET